jgi:hypothetical protein
MTCPSPHRVELPWGLESLGLTSTAAARSSCGGAMALVGLPAPAGARISRAGGAWGVRGRREGRGARYQGGTSRAVRRRRDESRRQPWAAAPARGAVPVRCRAMHAEQYASVVNVVASLARLLDMRAQAGRRARLGKGNLRPRRKAGPGPSSANATTCRPRSRADRPRASLCSVIGRGHCDSTTTYGGNTARTSEALEFRARDVPSGGSMALA